MSTEVWLDSALRVCLDLLFLGELVVILYVPPSNNLEALDVIVEAVNSCMDGSSHVRILQQLPWKRKPLVQHIERLPKLEVFHLHPGICRATPSREPFFLFPSELPALCPPRTNSPTKCELRNPENLQGRPPGPGHEPLLAKPSPFL